MNMHLSFHQITSVRLTKVSRLGLGDNAPRTVWQRDLLLTDDTGRVFCIGLYSEKEHGLDEVNKVIKRAAANVATAQSPVPVE